MSKLYTELAQKYYHYKNEKRQLMREYEKIGAKLDTIEGLLVDLNDILCKNGEHIYEHFEEGELK